MERQRLLSAGGRALIAVGPVVLASAVLWLLVNHGSKGGSLTETPVPGTPVIVDRTDPGFTQPLISASSSVSLARYEGKVVVVNFWASWCTACSTEASELESLWKSYRGRGVQVVGVDYEDRRNAAITFARSHGMSYPSVFDPKGTVGDAYGIFGLPTTYIIGPDDRIRYVITGKLRVASFRAALESILRATAMTGSSR